MQVNELLTEKFSKKLIGNLKMNKKIIEQALALADDVGIGDSSQYMFGQLQAIQGLLYFELAADDIRLEQLSQPEQPKVVKVSEVTNVKVMEKAFYALRDAHKYFARNEHTGQLEDECWLVLVALQTALSKEANNSNA